MFLAREHHVTGTEIPYVLDRGVKFCVPWRPMNRRLTQRGRERRQQLMDFAAQRFADQGYHPPPWPRSSRGSGSARASSTGTSPARRSCSSRSSARPSTTSGASSSRPSRTRTIRCSASHLASVHRCAGQRASAAPPAVRVRGDRGALRPRPAQGRADRGRRRRPPRPPRRSPGARSATAIRSSSPTPSWASPPTWLVASSTSRTGPGPRWPTRPSSSASTASWSSPSRPDTSPTCGLTRDLGSNAHPGVEVGPDFGRCRLGRAARTDSGRVSGSARLRDRPGAARGACAPGAGARGPWPPARR